MINLTSGEVGEQVNRDLEIPLLLARISLASPFLFGSVLF